MMAIRVSPGIEQARCMSRTSKVRKPEWDLIRGNHQGQRPQSRTDRPNTRLYLIPASRNFKKALTRRSHPHKTHMRKVSFRDAHVFRVWNALT